MSISNVVKFPKKFTPPPGAKTTATRRKTQGEHSTPTKYHDEVFEFDDGSYVVLVQPKKEKFTLERIVFMAERLKMIALEPLLQYEDLDIQLDPDPDKTS